MRVTGAEGRQNAAPTDHATDREAGLPLWSSLILLWLAGVSLRLTLLAVPPLLPTIHRALHLSETVVGALTGLPVLVLALAAVPGSLLVARLGARRALIVGLLVVAAGGALRGLGQSAPMLFAMTVVMGAGISASQPPLPTLARAWCGSRSGLATAYYSNGLLIGEIVGAAATAPFLLGLVGGWWGAALAVWSIPVALTALIIAIRTRAWTGGRSGATPRWWPDWRSRRTWHLGLLLGCAGVAYFGGNAFVPEYLRAGGHADLIPPALTWLNLAQLPTSVLFAALPGLAIGRRLPFMIAGALIVVATLGFLSSGGAWQVFWAGLLGMAAGSAFILSLALPPLMSAPRDVHRLSAAMFTVSYTLAFAGPLIGGSVWDHTGHPFTAFLPVLAAGAAMVALGASVQVKAAPSPAVH